MGGLSTSLGQSSSQKKTHGGLSIRNKAAEAGGQSRMQPCSQLREQKCSCWAAASTPGKGLKEVCTEEGVPTSQQALADLLNEARKGGSGP